MRSEVVSTAAEAADPVREVQEPVLGQTAPTDEEMIQCACGCKAWRTRKDKNGRMRTFLKGHQMRARMNDESKFWARVEKGSRPEDCWVWLGRNRSKGYGVVRWRGHHALPHRVAWELARGSIPVGLTIDHLCRNRRCVNPSHLEPVPNRTNILRGIGPSATNAKKSFCPAGHEYSAMNTRIDRRGKRNCRACAVEANRRARRRRKDRG